MSARVVLYVVAAAGLGWIARGATFGSAAASPSVAPRQIDRCPSPALVAAVADESPSDPDPDPDDESTGDDVGALLANLARGNATTTETHNGIHGVVTNQSTGGPLVNVTVILVLPNNGGSQNTVTNTDGEYTFTDLEAGTYTVTFYNNSTGVAGQPHSVTVNSFDVASLSERMETSAGYRLYEEPEYGYYNE